MRFPQFAGEWEVKKLGEMMEFIKDKIPSASLSLKNYVSTENLLQNFQGVTSASSIPLNVNVTSYKMDDILFSNIRPYLKKIWKANLSGGCSSDVFVFRNNESCLSGFLYYSIANEDFINYVMIGAKGVKMPRGDKEQIQQYPIFLPSLPEQQKIASFLSLIDERIATQSKIIDRLESLIKGVIQTLMRDSKVKSSWRKLFLRDILTESKEFNRNNYPVFSVSVSKGVINQIDYLGRSFAAQNTSNYNVVHLGDIVYTKSPTGKFPYGIVKQSKINEDAAVSPLYGVYKPKSNEIGNILHHYFNNPINTNNYLHSLIQKGAKNTINITNQNFLNKELFLPTDVNEIKIISDLLKLLSLKIARESSIYDKLNEQKKHLLKQMFI